MLIERVGKPLFLHRGYPIKGFFEERHVTGVEPFQVVDVTVFVDEFVGGEAIDLQELFDGTLLGSGQVIVNTVLACQIVFLDGVLPLFLRTAVGQIQVNDVEILQLTLHIR